MPTWSGWTNLIWRLFRRHDADFSCHRVSDKALVVRLIVQPVEVCLRRLLGAAVGNIRVQFDTRDGELAVGVLFKLPDCVVLVAVDDKTPVRRQREKRQHMAARQRRDERRLGIDALRIAQIRGRGGTEHLDAVVEPPHVVEAVILIAEVGAIARPFDAGFVFRHRGHPLCKLSRRPGCVRLFLQRGDQVVASVRRMKSR